MNLETLPIENEILAWTLGQAKAPLVRKMSQWVEDEIVLPTGLHRGERFRHRNHPVSRLWFDELDSGNWWRHAAVAPTQNGKTLMCYVVPVLYHLFEMNETVIIGLPDMRMANDKWERDILPVIMASRYRDMLPLRGEGTRGGKIKSSVTFSNGAMLRFMSSGGGDKARAGFAGCRVVAITEVDGMDEAGARSREGDPCKQIEARLRAYPAPMRRVYLECTASIPEGRIWEEYEHGSHSKIVVPCPKCKKWISPEREDLKGWQEATSEADALEKTCWHCSKCDHAISSEERESSWSKAKLIHEGQEVTVRGKILGDPPKTHTLGFRWGAYFNPFTTAAECGAEEWRAKRTKDKETAEKEILQWTNAMPWESPDAIVVELEPENVESRAVSFKRGIVPPNCIGISVGIDTHSRILYWEAKAIIKDPTTGAITLHVIDHATLQLDGTLLAKEAIIKGLLALKRHYDGGWLDESGTHWAPSQVWIDAGYAAHKLPIYKFCAAANKGLGAMELIWRPCKGHGEGQLRTTPYRAPENLPPTQTRANNVVFIGNDYWISRPKQGKNDWLGVQLVHVNSDTWKTAFHQGFLVEQGEAGSITLFEGSGPDRDQYTAQICGEIQKEKLVKDRGMVMVWHYVSPNHFLDAGYLATAAADFVTSNLDYLDGKRSRKNADNYRNRPQAADVAAKYANRPVAMAIQ